MNPENCISKSNLIYMLVGMLMGYALMARDWHEGYDTGYRDAMHEPYMQHTGHIEEDEPGWDCETMGNQICGEDLTQL